MCVFSNSEEIRVIGLLPEKDSFPIPVEEEFGGDVLIGYRSWREYPQYAREVRPRGALYSRHYEGTWIPGEVFEANGVPSTVTGRGIYAFAEETSVSIGMVRGKVAIWGRALDFEAQKPDRRGCMGQYAYPLELWVQVNPDRFMAWAETGVHIYKGVSSNRERVL